MKTPTIRFNHIVLALNLLILGLLSALFLRTEHAIGEASKKAYIVNQQVYESFHAYADLEKKLEQLGVSNRLKLDSMRSLLMQNTENGKLKNAYEQAQRQFIQQEKAMAEKYQVDLWKQINTYVDRFGKERGYDFIFGATGNGSLMYANNAKNVTEELIYYMNDLYEDK